MNARRLILLVALGLTACPDDPPEEVVVITDPGSTDEDDPFREDGLFCGAASSEVEVNTVTLSDGSTIDVSAVTCLAPAVAGGALCGDGGICGAGQTWTVEATDGRFHLETSPLHGIVPTFIVTTTK